MIYDCSKHESARAIWGLTIIFLNIFGAAIYFLLRWLPRSLPVRNRFMIHDEKQRHLQRAITDVRNIGKAYQFVKLGHLYQEVGQGNHALAVYQQALSKKPDCVEALWGAATVELKNKNFESGAMLLQRLMVVRPDCRHGDASLAYCQALFALRDFERAQRHLTEHLRQWGHPEASLLMAQIQFQQHNTLGAREVLERMITAVQSAPAFHYRKYRKHVAQGQRMLRKIG